MDTEHTKDLEFLGDAVLNGIVAEYLNKKYPNGDEGFLTKHAFQDVKRKHPDAIGSRGARRDMTIMNKTHISKSIACNAWKLDRCDIP